MLYKPDWIPVTRQKCEVKPFSGLILKSQFVITLYDSTRIIYLFHVCCSDVICSLGTEATVVRTATDTAALFYVPGHNMWNFTPLHYKAQ